MLKFGCVVYRACRTPAFKNASGNNADEGFIAPKAFKRMASNQADKLFNGYLRAHSVDMLERVFRPLAVDRPIFSNHEVKEFSRAYTGETVAHGLDLRPAES